MNTQNNFLTAAQAIEKYSELKSKFGWSPSELVVFIQCRLMIGYYDRTKKVFMLEEKSLKALARYTNQVLENQKCDLP